jgi:fructokinase
MIGCEMPSSPHPETPRIGFDIGGTKIAGGLVLPNGQVEHARRWPVPNTYQTFLELLSAAVADYDEIAKTRCPVGLGLAGILDYAAGTLVVSKLPFLEHQPLKNDLQARCQRPVAMGNDADCFALVEAQFGAGKDHSHVFGAIIGTGAGGAQIFNGRLVTGPNGVNGEWGHWPLPHLPDRPNPPPRLCHCGIVGCIETLISGGGLSYLHQFLHGMERSAPDIAATAIAGDKQARETLACFYDYLAKSFGMIILGMDPDIIVIGGGLRTLPDLAAQITLRLPQVTFLKQVKTKIAISVFDNESSVRGAAGLS